jgi:hypothetical protein
MRIQFGLPNSTEVIKSDRIRRVGHIARMWEVEINREFWSERLKGRDHLDDLSVDGRI